MSRTLKNIAANFRKGKQTVSDWKRNRKHIEYFCFEIIGKDSLIVNAKLKKTQLETLDEE